MKRQLITILAAAMCGFAVNAQELPDTTGLYADRSDTLGAAVASASMPANYMPKFKDIRTEVISAAGLCKMACCNLAESFENSASVSVGYADAVTGARQIKLLGQSGTYTQMLDENRPVMRGINSPWGLNYIPGQWLESIQIAKGVTSVINGVESMTGQINMEHRKTTDEKPLYVQGSFMSDTKADLNVVSSLQLDEWKKWSTVILGHVDGNFASMDHNGDGFMDDPRSNQISLGNRWLYYDYNSGAQLRFGFSAIRDKREGGQMDAEGWRSNILNRSFNGYVKFGMPLGEDQNRSIAMVVDFTRNRLDSNFGPECTYDANQTSTFLNLLYQDNTREAHKFTAGISHSLDVYEEALKRSHAITVNPIRKEMESVLNDLRGFGEYTFHAGDKFSSITGVSIDWFNGIGVKVSPRLTLRYAPSDWLVLRANGGRGLRRACPLTDNIGLMSSGKSFIGEYDNHLLEQSWTYGGNVTFYMPFGATDRTSLSIDYFRTDFVEQMLVSKTADEAYFKSMMSMDGQSFTNNWQIDFSVEPIERFTVTLTGRYTDARQTIFGKGLCEKPMTSRYKGVLNMQYSTLLSKWIFDFTASINGPCAVWDYMREYYPAGETPVYPLLYAQVTRRFKGVDIYLGGENLTNFKQKNPIINAGNPYGSSFDASSIWGPLMGIKVYLGVRFTLWKTE